MWGLHGCGCMEGSVQVKWLCGSYMDDFMYHHHLSRKVAVLGEGAVCMTVWVPSTMQVKWLHMSTLPFKYSGHIDLNHHSSKVAAWAPTTVQ